MEFIPLVQAIALLWKIVDFLKYSLDYRQSKAAVHAQLAVWVGGIMVAFLLARSDFAGGVVIGELPMSQMNGASLVFIGLSLGSVGSVLYDFKKARDNTDSAGVPPLQLTSEGR